MTAPDGPPDAVALRPGTGAGLRRKFLALLGFALPAALISLAPPLWLAARSPGEPLAWTVTIGCVLALVSWLYAFAALARARTAVHGDVLVRPVALASASLARTGGRAGWLGAPLVLAAGLLQHARGVDDALALGMVLAAACLVPAVSNDGARRLIVQIGLWRALPKYPDSQ